MDPADYENLKTEIFHAIWNELDGLEEQIENDEHVPAEIVDPILRRTKVFGLLVPKKYGGAGMSTSQYLNILSEFSKIQGGIRVLMHVHNSAAHMFSNFASEEQCQEILPKIAQGHGSIAFALTEPEHGTGLDIGATAVRDRDDYVINGRKWLITNSDRASHFICVAKTSAAGERPALSTILVPRGTPGLTITPLPETMGCKGGEHGQVDFVNVRVPYSNLLGREGKGLDQLVEGLEISRLFIAFTSLGTAERALELSLDFARKRKTFGKPLAARQAIQRYLAEMAADVYCLRNICEDAARKWDQGRRIPAEASMCKLFGLEAVGRVTDRALLVHGGIGYTRRHPVERLYRDARLNWLEEGPPTIHYGVITERLIAGYDWNI